jgi:hypothetical protein
MGFTGLTFQTNGGAAQRASEFGSYASFGGTRAIEDG